MSEEGKYYVPSSNIESMGLIIMIIFGILGATIGSVA